MKSFLLVILFVLSCSLFAQQDTDKAQIETTLNNYIDAFYKGDTTKLKAAIKPRLNKFGYWKNKASGNYEYYDHMSYDKAMAFVTKMKLEGKTRDEDKIRAVKVLDIGNHIASAKVTANWGVDYVLLSKDDGKWMIEQVIWEGPYQKEAKQQQTTTYYLIRHAEKDRSDKTNRDPHLTEVGQKRAANWANVLKDVKFDMVYSTDYNRTKETATPTAKANNIELTLYDPRNMDGKAFMNTTKGKTVLVVGHSNTTPMFANALAGDKKYDMISDDNNANLYIVTITRDTKTSTLLKVD
ncbi:histidine phosphatase family protein [uncultured Winogradskyella sp.]|uniref:histidine phosphatase family protein n=1 Tax=uncultured Winogradskyella sp. TaxID=395353 RepID=UPI00263924AA|nr:histidine phosphatase family protein [uncultured Winogradskyella sp.]